MVNGKPATVDEREWMDAVRSLGCIVCDREGHPGTPAVIHHVLSGGRRMGHMHVLPLCEPGHHQQSQDSRISRHPWRKRFEAAYGTEAELLEIVRARVAAKSDRLGALAAKAVSFVQQRSAPSGGSRARPIFRR